MSQSPYQVPSARVADTPESGKLTAGRLGVAVIVGLLLLFIGSWIQLVVLGMSLRLGALDLATTLNRLLFNLFDFSTRLLIYSVGGYVAAWIARTQGNRI